MYTNTVKCILYTNTVNTVKYIMYTDTVNTVKCIMYNDTVMHSAIGLLAYRNQSLEQYNYYKFCSRPKKIKIFYIVVLDLVMA